jgi:hypothetical protein
MGVSLTTLKKWLRRYRAEGPVGLLDRRCRPHCSPRRLSGELTAQVIALRKTFTIRFTFFKFPSSSFTVAKRHKPTRLAEA